MFVPGGWRWPRKKDTLMYSRSDVIQKLRPPVPVNSRGLFTFEDLNMNNNWFCCQCTFTVKHLNSMSSFIYYSVTVNALLIRDWLHTVSESNFGFYQRTNFCHWL